MCVNSYGRHTLTGVLDLLLPMQKSLLHDIQKNTALHGFFLMRVTTLAVFLFHFAPSGIFVDRIHIRLMLAFRLTIAIQKII